MKHIIILIACFCISHAAFSQAKTVKRIELTTENSITNYIPFGNIGILQRSVDNEKLKADKKNFTTTYTIYNTNLEKVTAFDLKTPDNFKREYKTGTARMFFEMSFDKHTNYILHCIDITTLKSQTIQGKMPKGTFIRSLEALDNYVIVKGDAKGNHLFFFKNIKTNEESIARLSPVSRRDFKIIGYEADTVSQEYYVLYRDKINNEITTIIQVYANAKKTQEFSIPNGTDNFIQNASVSITKDGSYIISGTYGNSLNKEVSSGIFICKMKQQKVVFIKYINYLNIQNFTSFMSENRQEKIEKKKEKQEQKGKEFEMNYLMVPHKIIENNNQYLLVGEAFYPTYRRDCQMVTNASGGTSMQCTTEFDGYQYTHYFVYTFDQQGNMIWSNSKKLFISYKPYKILRFVDTQFKNSSLSILYGTGMEFHYTVYDAKGKETKSEVNKTIETENDSDNIRRSTMSTNYWYDNYFIAHGYQKIKNADEKDKRKVYYVNKIQVIQ